MTAPRSGFADVESQLGEPGQLGVSATLLDAAGEARDHLEYKAERRFPMASVVKVPIGMAFEMRSRRGEASFEEILTITSRTACPGPVSNPIDRMFYLPWRSRTETRSAFSISCSCTATTLQRTQYSCAPVDLRQ